MRRVCVLGVLVGATLAVAAPSGAPHPLLDTDLPMTRWIAFHFHGPDGSADTMLVALPRWYGRERHPALPLVISPHGRGGNAYHNQEHWGDLPGRLRFIVLDPDLHGRVLDDRTWAWPPMIDALSRLPLAAKRLIPYLRYDPNRVYAIGNSMGGQETLALLAMHPDLLAGAVASDGVTDFARRWYQFPHSALSKFAQEQATIEVGATPKVAPWLYTRRSPLAFARTIAFSGVPLQLWWNVLGLVGDEHEAMLESVWCVEDEQDPNLGPGRLADFDHVDDRRLWREGDRSSRPRAELDVDEWAA